MSASAGFFFGRAFFERFCGHRYVPADSPPADERERNDARLFAWVEAAQWGLFPDVRDRRVAIVGNADLKGRGREIDAYDEVVRINRMGHWRHHPVNDGVRVTIWAGLPWANIIPSAADKAAAAPYLPSCFPEIASQLSVIWSVTPFHLSMRFNDFLRRNRLDERLLVSGGGLFLYDYLIGKLPPDTFRALYTVPSNVLPEGVPSHQFNVDLLLTGVRIAFLCALAKASEIGLFGFDFFEGSERRPWEGHDLPFNKAFLGSVVQLAATWNTRIRIL